jgi:O-antigen/teichoic acid export membrane protein
MVYFASGNFWLTTSRVVSIVSGLVLTVAFANLIPPEVFGTYKYVIALLGIFGAFSLNSLGTSVVRTVAQGNKDIIRPLFWKSVTWSIPASLAAGIGSLYYYINGNNELGLALVLIMVTNPFFNSFVVYKSLFVGSGDFKAMALYTIPRTLLSVAVMVAVLVVQKDIYSILLAYFISSLLLGWWMYTATLRKYKVASGPLSDETKGKVEETMKYGKDLSALGIIVQVMSYADQFILWHFVGPLQLAIYSFAQAPVREIRNFSENFFPIIFPKYATKSMEDVKKSMGLRIGQMFLVSLFICIAYIIAAPFIFKLLFPKYITSVLASQVLALAILFQPKGLIETLITAHGDIKKKYATTILSNISRIILLGILIPVYGFIGGAIAITLSELISGLIYYLAYKRL